jgi:hypothetical protein
LVWIHQLLDTQNDLAVSGLFVATAESIGEAFHLFRSGDFDLVVLCHTIPEKDRDGLTCMIRASGSLIPRRRHCKQTGQDDFFANATLD